MQITRLDETIKAAGIPIHGVSGKEGAVRIDFAPEATDKQRSSAVEIVAAFDWSDEADAAAEALEEKAAIIAAIDKGSLKEGDKSDQVMAAVVKAFLVELNVVRAKVGMPDKAADELFVAIKAEVNGK